MKLLLLPVLFLLHSLVFSQTSWTWNSKNGPYGSTVYSIAATSGGTYFAATTNGVFSSADAVTWTKANITTNSIAFISVAVASSGTIYALQNYVNSGFSGLYSSTDGGLSWSLLSSSNLPANNSKIKVAPKGYIYISYSGSTIIQRSTDNGATFTALPITFLSNVTDIAVDGNNKLVVATQSNGVQVSSNDGISFNPVGSGLSANIFSLTIDGSNNIYVLASDGPYRSTNSGLNWVSIKGSILDLSFSGLINTDASGNLYLINFSSTKLYFSANAASGIPPNWTLGTNYNAANTNTINCAYFKNSTPALLGRSSTGIDLSTDGGNSWSSSSIGIKGLNSPRIIQTVSGRLFCAASMNGYFLSIDDGNNWNLIFSGSANTYLNGFIKLSDGSILGYGSGAIRTTNEGNSWTVQNSITFLNNVVTYDGINLYYPTGTDVSASTNQGVTWTPKGLTGIGSNSIQTIAPDNGGNLYLKVYNSILFQNEIWKVNNASTTAGKLTNYTGASINDLKVVAANVYVAAGATIGKSADGGTTWTSVNPPAGVTNISKIYLYDDSNLILQTNAGVYATTDGGSSWLLKSLQDAPSATLSDLIFGADQSVYAATNKSVVQKSSTPAILPVAPTGLAIAAKSVESVDLVFNDNAANETAYLLEASIGNNTSYQQVGNFKGPFTGPQNSVALNYINSGITADSVSLYYFRVRATNSAGNSFYSNEVSGNGLKNCTSTIPDNRSWTAVATADPGSTAAAGGPFTNAAISIQKIANTKNNFTISLYALGVTPTTLSSYTHIATSSATFVETCGQTYFQYDNTTAQDAANGNGTWNGTTLILKWQADPNQFPLFKGTTTLTLNPTDPAPAAPTLSSFVFSSTSTGLIWNSAPFATQYVIERSTTSGTFSGLPLATVNYPTVQYTDTGLTPGTTYYYRITAKNTSGSSAPSAQTSIMPPVSTLFSPVQNSMALNTDNQQGVSWGDLDGDGDEDYISPSFTNSAGQNSVPVFYENIGGGQFTRRTLAILQGENVATYRGANVIDINNDGKLDVYFPRSSGNNLADFVLINSGGWNFTKVVVSQTARANGFRAASFADYDRDGLADLFVADSDPLGQNPVTPSFLLKNSTAGGTVLFNQITSGSIVTNSVECRDLSWADFNNDGLQDMLVLSYNLNATSPNPNILNRLYKNNGDGTFTQVTGTVFDTDTFLRARTSSWGDIDNDGDLDLYIGSQSTAVADRLYQNNGNGTFTSLTSSAVAETGTQTFGSAFGDIDNDGDLDLIAINFNNTSNSIFINDGTGNFTKSTTTELLTYVNLLNIGGSFVDYDQNGFLDISTGRNGSTIPPYLFQNQLSASSSKNWIEVKLKGTVSNQAAIGARITVTTTSPARTIIREVSARTGYGSQNSLIQHFGLGSATSISQLQIKWPNGGVQTLATPTINQLITIPEDFTGPVFSAISPANAATNVNITTTLSFTLNKASTAVAGKNIKIFLTSNTTTPVFSIPVTSGTNSSNTITFSLPQGLNSATSYSVSIDAGAFTDIYGNPSLAFLGSNWQFTTSSGPTFSGLVPANGTTNVSTSTTFAFTLSGAATATSGKNINVFLTSGTSAPVFSIPVTSGTISGNTYTYTIPSGQSLSSVTSYSVSIDVGAFKDTNGNPSLALPFINWQFTTSDVVPPVISFTPVSSLPKASLATSKFTVTATDNVSVASVVMSYRKITFTQFQTLAGTPGSAANTYDFPLQASFFDDMGIEYFFTAKDPSNNSTVNPTTGSYTTHLTFGGAAAAVVGVSAGTQVANYTIISVPLDLTSSSVSNIFTAFGAPDITSWRLLKYKDSPQSWLQYPGDFSSVARGEGYFVISRTGQNLTFQGATSPNYNQANLFQLSLSAGYNLIGNPYTVPINWEDTRSGVTGVNAIKIFQNGNYVDGSTANGTSVIQPYSGGFVFAQSAVQVAVKMQINPGIAKKNGENNNSARAAQKWNVPIRMIQGEHQFNFGGVGMAANASFSYDEFDDFAPPSPFGTFEMDFPHPEHFMKNFSKDVVPVLSGYNWKFNVNAESEEDITLTWDNAAVDAELYLFDVGLQRPINMREQNNYVINPKSSKGFIVYYGTDVQEKLKPQMIFLGQAYPNPSSGITSIPFNLPDGASSYHVRVEVYDLMGNLITTLINTPLTAGFYNVTWDASASNASSGLYIYRAQVQGNGLQQTLSGKVILK